MKGYESVHCYKCAGTGLIGKINMAGIKSMRTCKHCKGIGRLRAEIGSDIWKRGNDISAVGLGKTVKLRR